LGCVCLPVEATFAKAGASVVAFDADGGCIAELSKGWDRTGEVRDADLHAPTLRFT
jgi:UDP-N-acetyl-D-mannosaminuronate dehydrogenase